MITETQLFSEVKNTLSSYDDLGLIDDITLRMWLRTELKSFGTNIMVLTDDIIEVKNGIADLPENFWMLKEAWKYTPVFHKRTSDNSDKVVYNKKNNSKINSCKCLQGEEEKYKIKEKIVCDNISFNVYYDNPVLLRLSEGFNRKSIDKDCINLPSYVKKSSKNSIRILNTKIQTEFRKGFIYLVYRALPTYDGELIIPETQHNDLYKYLLTFLKLKSLEELWLNNDDVNLGNKISYLLNQSENYRSRAHSDVKAGALNPASWKTIRNTNRYRHKKYEDMIPKQSFRR